MSCRMQQSLSKEKPCRMNAQHITTLFRLETFWRQVRGKDWCQGMPWASGDFGQKLIPVKLFGDAIAALGVGKSWARSMEAITLMPLLSTMSSKYSTFVLALLWKHLKNQEMMKRFWAIMVWSLSSLQSGFHPERNWNGVLFPEDSIEARRANTPLAGGYRGAVVVVQADLEYIRDGWSLESFQAARPCCKCQADSRDIPWTDHKEDASWRGTLWTNQLLWEEAHPQRCGLFDLPGLWLPHIHVDWMHCKHLGCDQNLLGSTLTYLTTYKMKEMGTEAQNMAQILACNQGEVQRSSNKQQVQPHCPKHVQTLSLPYAQRQGS